MKKAEYTSSWSSVNAKVTHSNRTRSNTEKKQESSITKLFNDSTLSDESEILVHFDIEQGIDNRQENESQMDPLS